jgi:DNA polymerase I
MDDIIIDGNALGYSCHNATTLSYGGIKTQAVYGFTRMLRDTRTAFPEAQITVLWDGYPKHRYEVFPEYKGAREEARQADPEAARNHAEYKFQVPLIQKSAELLGITQLVHPDYEADDMGALLCAARPNRKKRLVTGDTDWLQMLDENTEWFDPRKDGKLITLATLQSAVGYFTPDEYIQGKCLIGDTSDSIPGIPDIGPKTAMEFMAKWKSVYAFFDAVDKGTYTPAARKSKTAKSLHPEQFLASPDGRALFERNMGLMDLRKLKILNPRDAVITKGNFQPEKFKILCGRLGFVSITRNLDEWVAPFVKT